MSQSPIICSKCNERGHNNRTCGQIPKCTVQAVKQDNVVDKLSVHDLNSTEEPTTQEN